MANEVQLSILKQGVEVWNKWREENPDVKIDFTKANLWGKILRDAQFKDANLDEADLSEADLTNANLQRASLNYCDLHEAVLDETNFNKASLAGANLYASQLLDTRLSECQLVAANLSGAYVRGCDFTNAQVGFTNFGNLDLRQANGLDSTFHHAASQISTDTFTRSQGKIPETFLRGCGLSDWEIEMSRLYNPDLSNEQINNIQYKMYDLRATQALQISPLFISYSHGD